MRLQGYSIIRKNPEPAPPKGLGSGNRGDGAVGHVAYSVIANTGLYQFRTYETARDRFHPLAVARSELNGQNDTK
jgi:hypothetical protein